MNNSDKLTVINELISNGENMEAIRLIEEGIDVNRVNDSDKIISILTQNEAAQGTPLYTACRVGNVDMIEYLLENGADPNLARYGTEYPLEVYLEYSYAESEDIVKKLVQSGADVNQYRIIPPMVALMSHYYQCEEEKKAIIESELLFLLEEGMDWRNDHLDTQYGGYSVLHFAATSDHFSFLEKLLTYEEATEYINSKTASGYTALHLAAKNSRKQAYDLLVEAGADPLVKDGKGKTAIEYFK